MSSRTSFPDGRQIRLSFVHKNPYKFKYAYEIKGVLIDPATIKAALENIAVLKTPDPEVDDQMAAGARLSGSALAATCSKITSDEMNTILHIGVSREALARSLAATVSTLNKNAGDFDKGVQSIESALPRDSGSCMGLRDDGVELLAVIGEIETNTGDLSSIAAELAKQKDSFDRVVPASTRAAMATDVACAQASGVVSAIDESLNNNIAVAKQARSRLAAKAPQLKSAADLIEEVHSKPDSFVEVRPIGPVDEATDYSISITRTNRADSNDKSTVSASNTVRLGTPAFSYSVGAAFGFSDQARFGRVPSVSGSGEVISVVEITESSDTQVGVVVQLNARIGSTFWDSSWGWSLGAALSQGTDEAQFGLYTGPYFAVGKRMFMTGAYHVFEETQLAGGFNVGDEVPDMLQGDVPTTKKSTGAFLLTLTYDFQ